MSAKVDNDLKKAKKQENDFKKSESNFKKAVNELLGTPRQEQNNNSTIPKEPVVENRGFMMPKETVSEGRMAYIPKDIVISGNISAVSDLKIAGQVDGDVSCEGNIELSGTIHGNVTVTNLKMIQGTLEGEVIVGENITMEESSVLNGNLTAKNVYSGGKIKGQIKSSELVELKNNACVEGDIEAKVFSVAVGAHISGKVHIINE